MTFTSHMRRLRHIYSMLANLKKEELFPNPTLHTILQDIKKVVDELLGDTAP